MGLFPQDGTIEKSVLANQVRPQQAFKVFQKVTNDRVNSRPGETYSYANFKHFEMYSEEMFKKCYLMYEQLITVIFGEKIGLRFCFF